MPKRNRTIFSPVAPAWKVRDMIAQLGGVGPTTEKLMAKGFFPPTADTIQGWSSRNSCPGAWIPALFAVAQDAGLIDSPMDALIRDFRLKKKGNKGSKPSVLPQKEQGK
jgi:hypothetical protein